MRALTRPAIALALSCALIAVGSVGPAGAARAAKPKSLRTVALNTARGARVVAGEALVRFRSGHESSSAASIGAREIQSLSVKGWKLVHLKANESVDHAIARLRADPAVADVTANHVYHSLGVPDDTLFGLQWGLQNTGQTIQGVIGTTGADISAPSAWDATTGSAAVIVAVADSGIASAHPDLTPNVIAGRNFVPDRPSSNTNDLFGHGTHVAGIIGANGNDGYGVTGVAQHVKILPVRVLDNTGTGDTSQIAQGFDYAATSGAKVVNASFGGPDPDPMLQQAIASHPGTLFVVAAGNNGTNNDSTPDYPCNYALANLICVAASDQSDHLASFSDYGVHSVHLAAPGNNIASTTIPDPGGYGGSGYSLADSPNGGYANNADTWAESSTTIDPGGLTTCNLTYKLRLDLAPDDQFTAETAPASAPTTWTAVDTISDPSGATTAGSFISRSRPVSADGSAFHVRFHLVSNATQTDEGVFVDNVSVVCGGSTIYGPDTFASPLTGYTTGGTANWGTTNVAGNWVYMSGTSMATPFVSGAAALIWAAHPTATVAHVKNSILGSVDLRSAFSGKTVTGGRLNAARALQYATDTTAPSGLAFTGAGIANAFQLSNSFNLGWRAVDSGTGVLSYDVRYEGARFNGGFNPWRTWRSGFTGTSATFSSLPGYTFCFQVRARDKALNLSAWSASRCTAFPVNDTALTASGGWLRLRSSLRYLGTYSYSKTRGSSLTVTGVQYKHLYLIVTMCPGCGAVQVFRGSTLIGSYSLNASSTSYKHQISVSRLSSVSGPTTITIKVSTSGLPVEIEGLGVSRL